MSACLEETGGICSLARIYFGFECAPAGKAMIVRDSQQSGEFGVWIGAAQIAQAILGEFLEIFERRALGKFSIGHQTPFF
ncbi:MAG TPA: hypothetical protein VH369_20385 [Bryobacteraceae bacterium]